MEEFTDNCKNSVDCRLCNKGYCQCFGISCGDYSPRYLVDNNLNTNN